MAEKNLVIVESPAKAKTIGKYLGRSYTVKASMGHLRDLPKSKLGIDIEHDFEPDYKPIRGKEALIRELKEAAKESDTVYLATDPDREGEAISWHLKALLNLDDEKAKRVTFNEITKKVVSESIKEPRAIYQDLVYLLPAYARTYGLNWTLSLSAIPLSPLGQTAVFDLFHLAVALLYLPAFTVAQASYYDTAKETNPIPQPPRLPEE